MSPETRKALAEALRGATVETLREDAEYLTRLAMLRYEGPDTFSRLSALALAVAAMQEDTDAEIEKCGAAVYLWRSAAMTPHESIPAALAALVEEP